MKCGKGHPVELPFLSEHEWGEFLLYGVKGVAVAYWNSYDGKAWDAIEESHRAVRGKAELLQDVAARCADPIDGESFSMTPVCTVCGGRVADRSLERPGKTRSIPKATFKAFLALDAEGRRARVRDILRSLA